MSTETQFRLPLAQGSREDRHLVHSPGTALLRLADGGREHLHLAPLHRSPSPDLCQQEPARTAKPGASSPCSARTSAQPRRWRTLSVGERQIVEIARALAVGSEVVIFDEPTSSLSLKEKEILFEVVRRLKAEGKAIIYISHFLDEILELCDRFIVLRNGRIHGQGDIGDVTKRDIIRMIVGKDINYDRKVDRDIAEKPALRITDITQRRPSQGHRL